MSKRRKIISTLVILGYFFIVVLPSFKFRNASNTDIVIDLGAPEKRERKWSETENEIRNLLENQDEVEVEFRHGEKLLTVRFRDYERFPINVDMFVLRLTNDHAFSLNDEILTESQSRKRIQSFSKAATLLGHSMAFILFEAGSDLTQIDIFTKLEKILPKEPNWAFVLPDRL
ncbi:hypothetical protein N8813_04670 [bacterium]|nr:hypothetical protein [bacterium]MDC0314679.1 hypothetical protein [bacterium]MDC0322823.1 hypothetical protein [Verrucomicrobiales bacterium]